MDVYPKDFCILIASHISYEHRIPFLVECLESLVSQSLSVPIYVSMSFENDSIKEKTILNVQGNTKIASCQFIVIVVQNEKTPQMKHFQYLLETIDYKHEWIMFCDDDDTYEQDRTLNFAYHIQKAKQDEIPNSKLIGLYEGTSEKTHREQRHEYWTYCVNRDIMKLFYKKLTPYPNVLKDKCCDVLFAEFLRRSRPEYYFIQLKKSFYNYRVENNTTSVTGYIQENKIKYESFKQPPTDNQEKRSQYIQDWNQYISENKQIYFHDVYLRTLVGSEFDTILQSEFLNNYELLKDMDTEFISEIKTWHVEVKEAANSIYDIPI